MNDTSRVWRMSCAAEVLLHTVTAPEEEQGEQRGGGVGVRRVAQCISKDSRRATTPFVVESWRVNSQHIVCVHTCSVTGARVVDHSIPYKNWIKAVIVCRSVCSTTERQFWTQSHSVRNVLTLRWEPIHQKNLELVHDYVLQGCQAIG